MALVPDRLAEWLETDGLGGFASGTVAGPRTRGYHALLLIATTPPTGRFALVNGLDAWVDTEAGNFAVSSQHYGPDVLHPDGERRLEAFGTEPWPRWTYRLEDGTRVEQELFVPHGTPAVAIRWRLLEGPGQATLRARPFLSGRDYHALHHENPAFRFDAEVNDARVAWRPYAGVPGTVAFSNGAYQHQPVWYRNFLYEEERVRGLDHTEDLASPGTFRWELGGSGDVLIFAAEDHEITTSGEKAGAEVRFHLFREAELKRRSLFPSRLDRSTDAYLVRRGRGKTVIAGYPWFTDWGRDTFIALRGLCLATGRLREALETLLDWSTTVSEGMLPNRFPDSGAAPEFNSVDASLWYVIAVHEFLQASEDRCEPAAPAVRQALGRAVQSILTGYARGTRYGIRADGDGLLAAGAPGVQLTWMDAKVGDWVVTPRVGKPVEVQALWLNALRAGSWLSPEWLTLLGRGLESFRARFWNESAGFLYDVVDADHQPGKADTTLRPNQILAVGGLPLALLEGERARRVVDAVEAHLWTPLGLRSLAPGLPGYAPHYQGGVSERDGAYHQGAVWPWLIGPFVDAWVHVRGNTAEARREARGRFLEPLFRHLDEAGLGHISEIADGDPPHTPRGCPFQAWSLGEALRLMHGVLREDENGRPVTRPACLASTGPGIRRVAIPAADG
ncbi:MAG TPA: amylo-alpha-1,6-glucosidase [Gemmataceae bacterium]|nr:amylo-alpha-1,6-glucosidase [Gemmataceae bacterium]